VRACHAPRARGVDPPATTPQRACIRCGSCLCGTGQPPLQRVLCGSAQTVRGVAPDPRSPSVPRGNRNQPRESHTLLSPPPAAAPLCPPSSAPFPPAAAAAHTHRGRRPPGHHHLLDAHRRRRLGPVQIGAQCRGHKYPSARHVVSVGTPPPTTPPPPPPLSQAATTLTTTPPQVGFSARTERRRRAGVATGRGGVLKHAPHFP
jgi:hypothetical protein